MCDTICVCPAFYQLTRHSYGKEEGRARHRANRGDQEAEACGVGRTSPRKSVVIEDRASGTQPIQDLRSELIGVRPYRDEATAVAVAIDLLDAPLFWAGV